jgi:CHAT domain-containing protein/tetratricopeptide (TPR) repeat protein
MAQFDLVAFLASSTPQMKAAFLREALSQLPKNQEEIHHRIELCRQGLALVEKKEYPALWADLHLEMANSLAKSPKGSREGKSNLELAIDHYKQALTVYTRMEAPKDWAATQYSLGAAYVDRIRGERADNLKQAIAYFNQALTVYTSMSNPQEWAATQHMLGVAYYCRTDQRSHYLEWSHNLEQAIAYFNHALTVYSYEAAPELWAGTQHFLGVAYGDRISGERTDNLEKAITHYNEALRVRTRAPEDCSKTQHCLGAAYVDRIRGERADNLEQAIGWLNEALETRTRRAAPQEWARTQHHLGTAYLKRIRGKRSHNLEQAIAHFKQALRVRTYDANPQEWAESKHNLAAAYLESKHIHGERADNVEQAIAIFKQMLQVRTREVDPQGWADAQHMLAVAYAKRLLGKVADNLEETIAHCYEAQAVQTREANPTAWAEIQLTLGNAYGDRRLHGKRAGNVDKAITRYNEAIDVYTLQHFPDGFQRAQRNLGHLHFEEGAWPAALAAYQEAIRAERVLLVGAYTEAGQQALVAETAELYTRAAYALLKVGRIGEALAQLEKGKTRLLSQALALDEVNMNALSDSQQDLLCRLRRNIRVLKNEMRLPSSPARYDGRKVAWALSQHSTELHNLIEQVRTTNPDFMPDGLRLSEILSLIPPAMALVAPMVTSHGSAVFVVPTGLQSVGPEHVLWLDEFKQADLKGLLGSVEEARLDGWLGAYFNAPTNLTAWFDVIVSTGQVLWRQVMAPIAERLATLQVTQVLFMPQGGLGLLPLHAAWREIDGTRRYFIDEYAITYVPSAYAHKMSLERMRDPQRREHSLLAVINPTEDLPFASVEGAQVASLFDTGNAHVLPGAEATAQAVIGQATAGYVHFACHGFYDWDDPMRSGVDLANRKPLTVAQIIGELNLKSTRLVTLSGCETGITDIRHSPDEYLGMPAGFLQAGAPAVVSTLWEVIDLSTMLVMKRFYQLHLRDGLDLPEALRQAQLWLRDVTASELAQRFADEALVSSTHTPIEIASEYLSRFATQEPSQRPFAHPFYWAAFTFSGV